MNRFGTFPNLDDICDGDSSEECFKKASEPLYGFRTRVTLVDEPCELGLVTIKSFLLTLSQWNVSQNWGKRHLALLYTSALIYSLFETHKYVVFFTYH